MDSTVYNFIYNPNKAKEFLDIYRNCSDNDTKLILGLNSKQLDCIVKGIINQYKIKSVA